jgi:hypothetical protein
MWGCQVIYIPTRSSDKTKLPVSPNKLHLPPNGLKNATSTMTMQAHEMTGVESPAAKRRKLDLNGPEVHASTASIASPSEKGLHPEVIREQNLAHII